MANIRRLTRKKLGEILLAQGLVTNEQVQEVISEQENTGELSGEIFVRWDYASEYDIACAVATQFSTPFIRCTSYKIPRDVITLLPPAFMRRHLIVPMDKFGDTLAVVIAGPIEDDAIVDQLEEITQCSIQVYIGTVSDVKAAIEQIETRLKANQPSPEEQTPQPPPDESP
jgi:type IV pilus assembly protein PilB